MNVIYFRGSLTEEEELLAAEKYFKVIQNRTSIKPNHLVIPRYSALPFYKELEEDVTNLGAKLINSYRQHCYVADLKNWYYDIKEYTFKTWFNLDQIPDKGPFVLKGATNSMKQLWSTHAFAKDKQQAVQVYTRLAEDSTVGVQPIYVRQYTPLKRLGTGLNGLPISEEYRFFMYQDKVLAKGFYWSSNIDDYEVPDVKQVPEVFINTIAKIVSKHINFWVMDIARTEQGNWVVVELNDGQQSGLSCINPEDLYNSLKVSLCT